MNSKYYTRADVFNILSKSTDPNNIYYKEFENVAKSGNFIFFFIDDVEKFAADDKIHAQRINLVIQIYYDEVTGSKSRYMETVSNIVDEFQTLPVFSNASPFLTNVASTIFHVSIFGNVLEWIT